MAAEQSPTVRRRRLGHELRELRERAGLTLEEAAALLDDFSAAKISRIETAKVRVRPGDVEALLTAYGVQDVQQRANLITLTRESRQRGWWNRFTDAMSPLQDVAIGLEAEAVSIRTYSPQVVSGVFQTESYARAVLKAIWASEPSEHVERRVALRMARQEILQHQDRLQINSVIEDCVLRRPVGGYEILREQLRRLAEVAELPNISIRVLPLSVGAHPGHDGAFRIIDLSPPDPSVVHLEYPAGANYMERPGEVRLYSDIFERLEDLAMTSEESLELIIRLSGEKKA